MKDLMKDKIQEIAMAFDELNSRIRRGQEIPVQDLLVSFEIFKEDIQDLIREIRKEYRKEERKVRRAKKEPGTFMVTRETGPAIIFEDLEAARNYQRKNGGQIYQTFKIGADTITIPVQDEKAEGQAGSQEAGPEPEWEIRRMHGGKINVAGTLNGLTIQLEDHASSKDEFNVIQRLKGQIREALERK